MDAILIGINAKFIHTNLAIRSLKANSTFDVDFHEFTIKDSIEYIVDTILEFPTNIIGFSTYIWNIELILKIIPLIKEKSNKTIFLGGPEVSYDSFHLLSTYNIDYIILGEGEYALDKLIQHRLYDIPLNEYSSISYKIQDKIILNEIQEIKDLSSLTLPYYDPKDIENIPNKIQYIESSRGCPFHCAYCMASLEKTVRYFNIDKIKEAILYLLDHGAKTFKFLDRTFNINTNTVLDLFDFIIEHHKPNTVFQFEITGDILPKHIIEYVNQHAPKHLFRFEIGIQSTNKETNLSVNRNQNNELLFENIMLIQNGGVIDLHLDLIAGLPHETISLFEKTFNECFSLKSKELQLGFLKMLKGTNIRKDASMHHYQYDNHAPYQIIKNDFLTKKDIHNIHMAEEMLEKYWNSGFCNKTLEKLFFEYQENPFQFFMKMGNYWENNNYPFIHYQLDELFKRFDDYLQFIKHPYYDSLHDELKYDYLRKNKLKPKIWWPKIEKRKRNQVLRDFFDQNKTYKLDVLFKYSLVTTYQKKYLIVIYKNNNKFFHIL